MKRTALTLALVLLFISVRCAKESATAPASNDPRPTVKITSPLNNSEILDSTIVEVEASDDKGVVQVEIYIDNVVTPDRVFKVKPYQWKWNVGSLVDSSLHTVYAKAIDADNNVGSSPVVTVTAYQFAPSGLAGTIITDTSASLSWKDNSKKETGYEIEQNVNNVGFVLTKTVGANATKTEVNGTYKIADQLVFRVRAISAGVGSKYSNSVSLRVVFPAPSGLAFESLSAKQLRLTWSDNSTFEKGFAVERMTGSGSYTEVQRTGSNVTAWIDNQLDSALQYSYRVRAFTEINPSLYTNQVTASYYVGFVATSVPNTSSVWHVRLSPDKSLVACSMGGGRSTIDLHRASDGLLVSQMSGHNTGPSGFEFFSNGDKLVSTGGDGALRVWRVPDAAMFSVFYIGSALECLALSPNESFVAVGGNSGNLRLVGVADGSERMTLGGYSDVQAAAFSADGTLVAGGCDDHSVRIYRVSDGVELKRLTGHLLGVTSVAFSPNGKILASGDETTSSSGTSLMLWSLPSGSLLSTIQAGDVRSLDFSPDGETVVAATGAGEVAIYRLSDGARIGGYRAHPYGANSVKFSLDGKTITSGGANGVMIWSIGGIWK